VIRFLQLTLGEDRQAVEAAIARVLDRGWYILGPELEAFEREFAAASGAAHAAGVNTGTDALALALRGIGVGPGDEVITSPLSAAYSALAIVMAGARPVFADVDAARLTLDPAAAAAAVTPRTGAGSPRSQPGTTSRSSKTAARRISRPATASRSERSARRAHSVSIRRRISARSATPARS
jgi:dTDP-4-amino-4,6-dideoxygalactose transaminase